MTGTAKTEEKEFVEIYDLHVVEIPTNVAVARDDQNDYIFKTKEAKYDAVIEDIKERHEKGQPVLVGTISVEVSEHLSQLLTRPGIPHNVLNAKQHEREAEIIKDAGAGRRGHDRDEHGRPRRRHQARRGRRRARRPLRARHRAPRGAAHRQPAARPLGPPGRPGRVALLPLRRRTTSCASSPATGSTASWSASSSRTTSRWSAGSSRSQIENAQKKVEEQNFVARKNVLKYDDVMNVQRAGDLRAAPPGARGRTTCRSEIDEWIDEVVERHRRPAHRGASTSRSGTSTGSCRPCNDLYGTRDHRRGAAEDLDEIVARGADRGVPGRRARRVRARRRASGAPEVVREVERFIVLEVVDTRWREHLENMDYLREGIHLRAMAQKDPLVEYRAEGHVMFEELGRMIREEVAALLFHAQIEPQADGCAERERRRRRRRRRPRLRARVARGRRRDRRGRGWRRRSRRRGARERRHGRVRRRRRRSRPSSASPPSGTRSAATTRAGAAPARSTRSATARDDGLKE